MSGWARPYRAPLGAPDKEPPWRLLKLQGDFSKEEELGAPDKELSWRLALSLSRSGGSARRHTQSGQPFIRGKGGSIVVEWPNPFGRPGAADRRIPSRHGSSFDGSSAAARCSSA